MQRMENDLERIGEKSKKNDLAVNLLTWASYQHSESTIGPDGKKQTHTMSFAADANSIMWTDIVTGEQRRRGGLRRWR